METDDERSSVQFVGQLERIRAVDDPIAFNKTAVRKKSPKHKAVPKTESQLTFTEFNKLIGVPEKYTLAERFGAL